MESMEQAHARDMQDQRELRDLRLSIESFLLRPHRLHRFTHEALSHAAQQLREDEQRTVARWD